MHVKLSPTLKNNWHGAFKSLLGSMAVNVLKTLQPRTMKSKKLNPFYAVNETQHSETDLFWHDGFRYFVV
jgi:hypothetical protein